MAVDFDENEMVTPEVEQEEIQMEAQQEQSSSSGGPVTYAYHINCWEHVLLNVDPELREKYVMWANLPLIIGTGGSRGGSGSSGAAAN